MADKTPRKSAKSSKHVYKATFSNYPESPLGATPRPNLRQQYPEPPPMTELKFIQSTTIMESSNYGSNEIDFTPMKKKKQIKEFTEVQERFLEHRELKPEGSTRNALLILTVIFLSALIALGIIYYSFPRQKK